MNKSKKYFDREFIFEKVVLILELKSITIDTRIK